MRRPKHWYWYQSPEWRKLRREVLKRQGKICRFCSREGAVVDHIKPHDGDLKMFFNYNNLQVLCSSCHSGVKRQVDQSYRREKRELAKWVVGEDGWLKRRKVTA